MQTVALDRQNNVFVVSAWQEPWEFNTNKYPPFIVLTNNLPLPPGYRPWYWGRR